MLPEDDKIISMVPGDEHTVVLTSSGRVFVADLSKLGGWDDKDRRRVEWQEVIPPTE